MYCDICDHCAGLLKRLRDNFESKPYGELKVATEIRVYQQSAEIVKIIRRVQKAFSLISSLLCLVYFFICFSGLSFIFSSWKNINSKYGFDFLLFSCNAIIFLVTLMVSASKVPLEMHHLGDTIEEKQAECSYHKPVNSSLVITLNHVTDVTLSASELLYFQRNSVFAVTGSMIMHSRLIYNLIE